MIYPIIRDTKKELWCAPASVCALTGRPASEVIETFKFFRKGRQWKMPLSIAVHILELYGLRARMEKNVDLNEVFERDTPNMCFIVMGTKSGPLGHFFPYYRGTYVENWRNVSGRILVPQRFDRTRIPNPYPSLNVEIF